MRVNKFDGVLTSRQASTLKERIDVKTGIKNRMPENEKSFCEYFALCGDAVRAADFAGYKNPKRDGTNLLCRADIRKKINSICETMIKSSQARACLGYERLALGSISDAIKLLYCEKLSDEELQKLDLTNVAEIKKPKDGAMEIKFFDRLKALEKLSEFDRENVKKTGSIFEAIKNSARALEKADDYGEN